MSIGEARSVLTTLKQGRPQRELNPPPGSNGPPANFPSATAAGTGESPQPAPVRARADPLATSRGAEWTEAELDSAIVPLVTLSRPRQGLGLLGNWREITYTRGMVTGAGRSLPTETVLLGPNGEVRVPEGLRHQLGWHEGDRLALAADESGGVKVLTVRDAVRSVRGMLTTQAGGRLLADELIEERRREVERE